MEFFDYSLNDLNRKINRTIFTRQLPSTGRRQIWMFGQIYERRQVESATSVVEGWRVNTDGTWESTLNSYNIMDQIEFFSPVVGYVNYRGAAQYLIRNVSKQYKLGFNLGNYKVGEGMRDDKARAMDRFSMPFLPSVNDAGFIEAVVNRKFMEFNEVVEAIEGGSILSGAINPHIALAQTYVFHHPVIIYKDKVVGYRDMREEVNYLFSPAEYVAQVLPFDVEIQERSNALISRY